MDLGSTVFEEDEIIPGKYSCDGQDISPPLHWEDAPEDTESFAMIVDDPDAPNKTWVHWVIYNIPGEKNKLAPNIPDAEELEDGTLQGINDFDNIGYGGPCPPEEHGAHHYHFKLYALNSQLSLDSGATKTELLEAMEGHILEEAELVGLYER